MFDDLREEVAAMGDQHGDHGHDEGHHDDHGVPHDDEKDGPTSKKKRRWIAAVGTLLLEAVLLALKLAIALELLGAINLLKTFAVRLGAQQ